MGRKKRVSSLQQMRNCLPVSHMGDKNFSNPEYSQGFWAQEGVVPSLTMRKRVPPVHHTKTLELDSEMLLWKAPRRATFAEKQKDNERRAEMNDVSLLPEARKQKHYQCTRAYMKMLNPRQQPNSFNRIHVFWKLV